MKRALLLQAMMKNATFDINTTACGPNRMCTLQFALGGKDDEPIDEKAMKLVLAVPACSSM